MTCQVTRNSRHEHTSWKTCSRALTWCIIGRTTAQMVFSSTDVFKPICNLSQVFWEFKSSWICYKRIHTCMHTGYVNCMKSIKLEISFLQEGMQSEIAGVDRDVGYETRGEASLHIHCIRGHSFRITLRLWRKTPTLHSFTRIALALRITHSEFLGDDWVLRLYVCSTAVEIHHRTTST